MRVKTKKISIMLSLFAFICSLSGALLVGFLPAKAQAQAASNTTQAYYMHSDYGTMGAWYAGEGDGQKNADGTSTRYYGKAGAILMYQYSMPDGCTYKMPNEVNNFNDNSEWDAETGTKNPKGSKVHYVELPSWVNSVTGNIGSSNADIKHDYWNCSQLTLEQVLENAKTPMYQLGAYKHVLPVNKERSIAEAKKYPERIANFEAIYLANGQTGSPLQYDVDVTDDEWHLVTIYTGNYWPNRVEAFTGFSSRLSIKDPQGNVVAEHIVEDFYKTAYVTFAVKGDFTIYEEANTGVKSESCIMSIFFDEFPDLGENARVENVRISRSGPREIILNWDNKSEDLITSIYRRIKNEETSQWEKIAELPAGKNTYHDLDTTVSTIYEYALSSGRKRVDNIGNVYSRETDIVDSNLPDFTQVAEISTADYKKTKIVLDKALYDVAVDKPLKVKATLYKEDANGEFVPFNGVMVKLTLGGGNAYVTTTDIPNMQTNLGEVKTTRSGVARFEYEQPYPGEYIITASINAQPDPIDNELGYDMSFATATFIQRETKAEQRPILTEISDAIKPGETVTLMGHNLNVDSEFLIAYAPNQGTLPGEYDEDNSGVEYKYLSNADVIVSDAKNSNALMFIMPKSEKCGKYDFWVKTTKGWSNGITLNAVRALYFSQEAGYEGQQIEVVGRNFFTSEYGVGTEESSLDSLRVKLVNKADSNVSYVIPVLKGVRYDKETSVTGNVVYHSNPYKITFEVPQVTVYGEYDIYVAAEGEDFRKTEAIQTFSIVEKKAQNWDQNVFGAYGGSHIGNDPLDLGVYWAQDLNYTNVRTISSNKTAAMAEMDEMVQAKINELKDKPVVAPSQNRILLGKAASVTALANNIVQQTRELNNAGGGVIYFPEGEYYLCSFQIDFSTNNVLFIGAGADKTIIYFTDATPGADYFINIGATRGLDGKIAGGNNIGWARVAFGRYTRVSPMPDKFTIGDDDPDTVIYMADAPLSQKACDRGTYNRFVVDCNFSFNKQQLNRKLCRAMAMQVTAYKNLILKNNIVIGGNLLIWGGAYKYQTMSNCYMDVIAEAAVTMGLAKFCFMENLYVDNNYKGHGIKGGTYCYIGNCYVTRTGGRGAGAVNNGEAILFECPTEAFSVGSVLQASGRKFVYARNYGSVVDENTLINAGDVSALIIEGTGTGQLRRLKLNISGTYGNEYELADGEKDWDIMPDSTSKLTMFCPYVGITIYGTSIVDSLKPILLYGAAIDTVVANNYLKDSEGIAVYSHGILLSAEFVPSGKVRVENNYITGVSPVTGYGGIYVQSNRIGDYFGMQEWNIEIRGNILKDIQRPENPEYAYKENASEVTDRSGIVIETGNTSDTGINTDLRFITIEGNTIDNCMEYGVYCSSRVSGLVVRNNEITSIGKDDTLIDYYPVGKYASAYHKLYVNGELSELSGEYAAGSELPEAKSADGSAFVGWTTNANYTEGDLVTKQGFSSNVTLYAVFGNSVKLMYNYTDTDGQDAGIFGEFTISANESANDMILDYGNPFRVGYSFDGWYKDAACTEKADLSSPLTGNVMLYAKWVNKQSNNSQSDGTGDLNSESKSSNGAAIAIVTVVAGLAIAGGLTFIFVKKKRK